MAEKKIVTFCMSLLKYSSIEDSVTAAPISTAGRLFPVFGSLITTQLILLSSLTCELVISVCTCYLIKENKLPSFSLNCRYHLQHTLLGWIITGYRLRLALISTPNSVLPTTILACPLNLSLSFKSSSREPGRNQLISFFWILQETWFALWIKKD